MTYGYDHADVLSTVSDFNGNTITVAPNADGKPASVSLSTTGDTLSYTYAAADIPSQIALSNGSATLQSFAYRDAPSGAILSENDMPSSAASPASYGYDAQDRVISMTPGTGSALNYGFDASGNLTTLPNGASGSYDGASELTSASLSGTTTSFTYEAGGERLTAKQGGTTVSSASWNGARQVTAYSGVAASMSAVSYDGAGLRASTTVTPNGGSATTQSFVWNTVPAVSQLLMDSQNAYIFALGAAPAEQVSLSTGAISYLTADSLGSVRGIVSSTGTLTATSAYDAWGNPENSSGLIYLIDRYYDPATGQFLSVDPLVGQAQAQYSYADDDPVRLSDPTGCSACLGTFNNPVGKIHLWRTHNGTLGWDVRLSTLAKTVLGPDVVTSIEEARVNGRNINAPYGPHLRASTYDFHSSMRTYTVLGRGGGSGTIHTNDHLVMVWFIASVFEETEATEALSCAIPRPGTGTPGPFGPR